MNLNSELYVKNVPLSKKGSIIYLDPAIDIAAIRLYSLLNEFSNHKQMTNIGLLSVLLNEFGLEINGRETLNKLYLYRYISVNNLNKQIEVLLFQYKASINQMTYINKHYVNFVCDYNSSHFSDQLYANEISNEVLDLVGENPVNHVYKNDGEKRTRGSHLDDGEKRTIGSHLDDGEKRTIGSHLDDGEKRTIGSHLDDEEKRTRGSHLDDGEKRTIGSHLDDGEKRTIGSHLDDGEKRTIGSHLDDEEKRTRGSHLDDGEKRTIGSHLDDGEKRTIGSYLDDGEKRTIGSHLDDGEKRTIGSHLDDGEKRTIGSYLDDGEKRTRGSHLDDGEKRTRGSHLDDEGVINGNSQNSVGVINDDASLCAHSENIDLNKSVDTENSSLNTLSSDQQTCLLGDLGHSNNNSYASKTHDFNQIDKNSLKFNKIDAFDKKMLDTSFDSMEHNYTTTVKDTTNVSKLVSNNNIYKNTYLPTHTENVTISSSATGETPEPLSRSVAQPKNKVPSTTNNKRTYSYDDLDWLSVNLSTSNFIYDNFVSRKISFSDAQIVIAVIDQQNQLGLVIHSLSAFLNKLFSAAKKGTLYDPRKLVADRSNQSSSQNKLLENAQLRHHHVTYSNFVENNQHESATLYLKEHNLGWDGRRIYEKQ